jgi:hypothetical protein
MNDAVSKLATKSLAFALYRLHLAGLSAEELGRALSLPVEWVEERIEAIRLCLTHQVELTSKVG